MSGSNALLSMAPRRNYLMAADPVSELWANLPEYGGGNSVNAPALTNPGVNVQPAEFIAGQPVRPGYRNELLQLANLMSGFAGTSINAVPVPGIRAFHGSPHRFDRFDMGKIGTGEGAQAYGHGLYFAGAEDVARNYRDRLGNGLVNSAGRHVPIGADRDAVSAYDILRQYGGDFDQAIAHTRGFAKSAATPKLRAEFNNMRDWLDVWRGSGVRMGGHMYEVNLRTSPDRLLDWDAPLSQQPQAVRDALGRAGVEVRGGWQEAGTNVFERTGARGADANIRMIDRGNGPEWLATYDTLYGRGSQRFPTQEAARRWIDTEAPIEAGRGAEVYQEMRRTMPDARVTDTLRASGIDGIRYLDAGSRAAGEGSRNYVMFDDKLIDIIRRYGIVPPALWGASQAGDGTQ